MRRAKTKIIVILVLLVSSGITQCAPKPQIIKEDDEAILRRRVREYWSYKMKGEWDKAYPMETPEYRKKFNMVAYIGQRGRLPMRWEGFEILELWVSGEEGHVKMNTKYRYLLPRADKGVFENMVEEQWIKKEGQWYRFTPPL